MLMCCVPVSCTFFTVHCPSAGERRLLGVLRQAGWKQGQVQVLSQGSQRRHQQAQVPPVPDPQQRGEPLHQGEGRRH